MTLFQLPEDPSEERFDRRSLLKQIAQLEWCDVLILGGSLGAVTLAHHLALLGLRSVLVCEDDFHDPLAANYVVTSAITPHAGRVSARTTLDVPRRLCALKDLENVAPHLMRSNCLQVVLNIGRLVFERLIAARQEGAHCINHANVIIKDRFHGDGGVRIGIQAPSEGQEIELRCMSVVDMRPIPAPGSIIAVSHLFIAAPYRPVAVGRIARLRLKRQREALLAPTPFGAMIQLIGDGTSAVELDDAAVCGLVARHLSGSSSDYQVYHRQSSTVAYAPSGYHIEHSDFIRSRIIRARVSDPLLSGRCAERLAALLQQHASQPLQSCGLKGRILPGGHATNCWSELPAELHAIPASAAQGVLKALLGSRAEKALAASSLVEYFEATELSCGDQDLLARRLQIRTVPPALRTALLQLLPPEMRASD